MFAVIETGGKQIKVTPGCNIEIEKLPKNKGDQVSLENVLMICHDKETKFGNPYIKGAAIKGHITEQEKSTKVIVYKMRPKKGTRKKFGHRQWYSKVFIENIELDGKVIGAQEKKHDMRNKKQEEQQQEEAKPRKGRTKKKEE